MDDRRTRFLRGLRRQRRVHRAGLLLREGMRLSGYGVVVLLLFAASDFFLAFPPEALRGIGRVLLGLLAVMGVYRLFRGGRVSLADYAVRVDQAQGNRRQDVLAALELTRKPEGAADTLESFLVEESVGRGCGQLDAMRVREILPLSGLRRQGAVLLGQLALAALCLGIPRTVSGIILERIFHPGRDRPPFSPYRFTVEPEAPRVLYGQSVEIGVRIGGAPVRSGVWLLTRHDGKIQRAACFQDSAERFAQRLEQVIHPVEFAFATGRARSEWHRVDLLLDPRIVAARATVTPPAYSGKPTRSLIVGEEGLAELAGAKMTLEVASNRPLLDGVMTIRGRSGRDGERMVKGVLAGSLRIRFEWTLDYAADLTVEVRDVRGTANQQPFVMGQAVLDDAPPRAFITEPPAFSLATAGSTVKLAGYAEDDLGLRRVDLVRGLVGYRDRVVRVGPEASERDWRFEQHLDLAGLGVLPGQVLEFYLEAQDGNPDWTGVGASEVVRIEIISEEDYADLVRARLRTEDFVGRYREALRTIESLKEQLRELQERLEAGGDEAELAEQIAALQQAYEEARALFEQMARDFAVFDAETPFHETLREIARMMRTHRAAVEGLAASEDAGADVQALREALDGFDQRVREQTETAEHIASVGRVFELTQAYLRLVQAQEQLARRIDRYPDPALLRDAGLFESFRREEQAIREALIRFRGELIERAGELPEEYGALRDSSLAFAEAIDVLEIPGLMQEMIDAAENRRGREMAQRTGQALERMRQLITECAANPFGGLMECELRFQVRRNAQATLGQMMRSWAGLGMGAGIGDGYSTSAHTPLNVPLFGPGRSDAGRPGRDGGTGRDGGGAGGLIDPRARHVMRPDARAADDAGAPPVEQAPGKYREALRRYFRIGEENP